MTIYISQIWHLWQISFPDILHFMTFDILWHLIFCNIWYFMTFNISQHFIIHDSLHFSFHDIWHFMPFSFDDILHLMTIYIWLYLTFDDILHLMTFYIWWHLTFDDIWWHLTWRLMTVLTLMTCQFRLLIPKWVKCSVDRFAILLKKIHAYLKFGAHATHGVGVKFFKWEEFFPYLTRKEPLWNLVECVLFHTQWVIVQSV